MRTPHGLLALVFSLLAPFPVSADSACHPDIVWVTETSIAIPVEGSVVLPADADDVVLDWPIASFSLNSPFGPRQLGSQSARYDWHRGTDLKVPMGTSVTAPADAYVVFSGVHPGFSDPVIQLRHNTSEPYLYTLYLHMSVTSAVAGTTVAKGEEIGLSGQGTATYPHLHWEVRRGCLRQECCENVYGYMTEGLATTPPAPSLVAAGDSNTFGRMLLLGYSFPKDELDFQGVRIEWGSDVLAVDLDALNALTPTGQAAKLDDPLYFAEEHGGEFVLLPKRFNDTFASADYQFLAWGLSSDDTGTAVVLDSNGQETSTTLAVNLPPMTVVTSPENILVQPGGDVAVSYTVTNLDSVARTVTFAGISAQSLDIDLSTTSANIPAGESVVVTMDVELLQAFPEDVGDVLLLVATMQGGGWTPVLATTAVDTSTVVAAIADWWVVGE